MPATGGKTKKKGGTPKAPAKRKGRGSASSDSADGKRTRKSSASKPADPGPQKKTESPTTGDDVEESNRIKAALMRTSLQDITEELCDINAQSNEFYKAEARLMRATLGAIDVGLTTGEVDDGASAQQGVRISLQQATHLHAVLANEDINDNVGASIADFVSRQGGRLMVEIDQSYTKVFEEMRSVSTVSGSPVDVRFQWSSSPCSRSAPTQGSATP